MKISPKFEEIGYNNATVEMDIDALSRESMIRLFNVKNEANELMDRYDISYFEKGLPNTDEPGIASMFKEFIKLEGKLIGFLSQQFLYMIKPIQVALELAKLITNPKKLIEKIKEVIKGIGELIKDVIKFLTKTKEWFTDTLLGPLTEINVPIPEIEFSLLGINIKLPKIDNTKQFDDSTWGDRPNPYKENESDEITKIKKELDELNKKEQNLRDRLNINLSDTQLLLLSSLALTISLLYTSLLQESTDYFQIMMKIHEQIMIKQDLMIKILDKKKIEYIKTDKTVILKEISDEALSYVTENKLNIPNKQDKLENFADIISEIIDDEEEYITDVINRNNLRSNDIFNIKIEKIDIIISNLYQESRIELEKIRNSQTEIRENKNSQTNVNASLLSFTLGGTSSLIDLEKLKERKEELKKRLSSLSPASAWLESTKELIVGIIKAPIKFIIDLVKKLFEGITEFLKELPLPKFTKIREFFKSLLQLPNEDKMKESLDENTDFSPSILPTIINIFSVIPWLIITVIIEFVTGVIKPALPIPVTI